MVPRGPGEQPDLVAVGVEGHQLAEALGVGPGRRGGGAEPVPDGVEVAAETMAMSDVVTAEDKWIVERVQENLDAGIYHVGRLSPRHEGCVAAFQAFVKEATA